MCFLSYNYVCVSVVLVQSSGPVHRLQTAKILTLKTQSSRLGIVNIPEFYSVSFFSFAGSKKSAVRDKRASKPQIWKLFFVSIIYKSSKYNYILKTSFIGSIIIM